MQKRRGWSHLKNTAYVQRKIRQRNIDACPPVVVPLIPKERCSSLPGACIKALAIFELQKETKSKTKQIRGVYSNKISCRQDTKEMGGWRQHIEHPHGQGLLAFCLSLGIVLIPRGSKIHSNEISWNLWLWSGRKEIPPLFYCLYMDSNDAGKRDKFVGLFIQARSSATSLDQPPYWESPLSACRCAKMYLYRDTRQSYIVF